MADEKLNSQLRQAHDAIAQVREVDEEGERLLRDLDGHIRDLLERSKETKQAERPAMRQGVQDAIRHFEVTHPELTDALNDLLTALSNAGI